jgi:hypothetical protein
MKTKLTKEQLWNACVGMTWVWDYCKTGTAKANAPAIQGWIERRGDYTASLKVCAAVAAEIRRHQKEPFSKPIGTGFGEIRFP